MPETYPDDASLLSLTEDQATGVEYIPTGRSPYVLEFRKLVQRVLLASERANDLRVYQEGDLTFGVRAGRCFVSNSTVGFAGAAGVTVSSDTTVYVWLDSAGALQTSAVGLPSDRTGFVPLAEVEVGTSAITSVTDLRGEAFLQILGLPSMGLVATAAEINQALSGIAASVDSTALNQLTAGPESTADGEHRHLQSFQDIDGEAYFTLINNSAAAGAAAVLVMSLPNHDANGTFLLRNNTNGFISQRYAGSTYNMVGVVHSCFGHEGALPASLSGKLMGSVGIDGVVSDVILSVENNIQSSIVTDGVGATVRVNGVSVTISPPQLSASAGAGFRSTSRGDGVSAVIKTDGTEDVQRGDILSVDLGRTVSGVVSQEAVDVVVLVVIKASQPE
jgi:hypothetical protein